MTSAVPFSILEVKVPANAAKSSRKPFSLSMAAEILDHSAPASIHMAPSTPAAAMRIRSTCRFTASMRAGSRSLLRSRVSWSDLAYTPEGLRSVVPLWIIRILIR